MPSYRQNSHLPKHDADTQKLEAALLGWTQGVEALETGSADESIDTYRWALSCRSTLKTALVTAPFRQRKKIEARLPELDRRFTAATAPAAGCLIETRECDPEAEWWYFRTPASHPDWTGHTKE